MSIDNMITKMRVKITLNDDVLALLPADKEIHSSYIAGKIKDMTPQLEKNVTEELNNIQEEADKTKSIFHRDPTDGKIIVFYDYQIKGFFKECGEAYRQCNPSVKLEGRTTGKKWGSIRGKIDNFLRIEPRLIKVDKTEADGLCQRPLHAMTMQGPRTSLKVSETINAGTSFEFIIKLMKGAPITKDMIKEMLEYATQFRGFGQWRNSGKGVFSYEIEEIE